MLGLFDLYRYDLLIRPFNADTVPKIDLIAYSGLKRSGCQCLMDTIAPILTSVNHLIVGIPREIFLLRSCLAPLRCMTGVILPYCPMPYSAMALNRTHL